MSKLKDIFWVLICALFVAAPPALSLYIPPAQPPDADLTAIAGLSSNGLIARTDSGTVAARTITAHANANLVVTNGDGVAGNPTLDTAQDLKTSSSPTFVKVNQTQNASTLHYVAVNLSAADVDGLAATPKQIVAAQGVGTAILVDRVILKTTYSGTPFTGGGNITAQLTGGTNITSGMAASAFTSSANRIAISIPVTLAANLSSAENLAAELVAASDFTGSGTTTAVAHVWYRVVTL